MFRRRDAPEIGHSADIPQQAHILSAPYPVADFGKLAQGLQRLHVVGIAPPSQQRVARRRFQAFHQPVHGAELQVRVAPGQPLDGREAVVLDGIDQALVQNFGLARHAKGAGFGMASGAARDLADLVGKQRADAAAIELMGRRKGDVPDIQVQAHADGVGGDQVIDLSGLIHRHLGVARAG